jgi:hypothetical protein
MSLSPRTLVSVLCLLFACLLPAVAQSGQYSSVMNFPSNNNYWVPTHGILGIDGRVYYWSSYDDGKVTRIFDPATNAITTGAAPPYNMFCMGHTHLADGRLMTIGGHIDDYFGYAHASIYDFNANTWTQLPDMNAGRWYPTATTLPNGDVLAISGTSSGPASNQVYNNTPQVYQVATNSWRTLSSAVFHVQMYPFMFVAPNGKVFEAGWQPDSRYLDPSGTGAWTFVANSIHGWRNYGSAVMYDAGKIILIGGDGDTSARTPTNTAETIDLNAATPAWKSVASMHYARRQQNATLLPDGTIFVSGGSSVSGFDNPSGAVLPTEIYDPQANTWTVTASLSRYRGYHSFTLLLPDGRVFSAGGQVNSANAANGANGEIYSPPYLFKGARPTITSAPASVAYGATALIGTSDSIARVTWIRLGAATHAFNQEQRFLNLSFAAAAGGVNVIFPSSANLSPPGYYMLFLLNASGVPSVAKMIRIGGSSGGGGTGAISGKVTNASNGNAIAGVTVSVPNLPSTATNTSGMYTLSNVPTGSKKVTATKSGWGSQSVTVTVNAGATTTANIKLASSGRIGGTVKTSGGAAISGATVKFTGGVIATTATVTTSSTGTYTSPWMPVGNYTVTVSKTGLTTQSKPATVSSGATTTLNFTF